MKDDAGHRSSVAPRTVMTTSAGGGACVCVETTLRHVHAGAHSPVHAGAHWPVLTHVGSATWAAHDSCVCCRRSERF
eukprot:107658-Chlamydomonas_euryale.AAC.2